MSEQENGISEVERRLLSLRRNVHEGRRAPNKPLLVLLALGAFVDSGSSELEWSTVEARLGQLLAEFGRPARTSRSQAAAYPFTHLRTDGVWTLSRDVPMDNLGPLRSNPISGSFTDEIQEKLRRDPGLALRVARRIVLEQFPETLAADVLAAAGLDPEEVLAAPSAPQSAPEARRRRSAAWRLDVLNAWDVCCAMCGYDGTLSGAPVALEAAHIRWFNFGGPDDLANGLALCSLHHKLLDRGAVGLTGDAVIHVSTLFTARSDAAQRLYDLHGKRLRPRIGTPLPAPEYAYWHRREVFKGDPVAA